MGEHSPTPWVLMKPAPHLDGCLGSAHGFYISSFQGKSETPVCHLFTTKKDYSAWTEEVFPFLNDEADAAHIVHCVNVMPELVKALKATATPYDGWDEQQLKRRVSDAHFLAILSARAAIAKAEETA